MTKIDPGELAAQKAAKDELKVSGPPAQSIPGLVERVELLEKALGFK